MGFLNGDMDDDDDSDDETLAVHADPKVPYAKSDAIEKVPLPPPSAHFPTVQIVAPKPGYAAPVSALTDTLTSPDSETPSEHNSIPMPSPITAPPPIRQMPATLRAGPGNMGLSVPSNRTGLPPPTVPSTPHPLLPPSTPIVPAFARPPPTSQKPDVKFSDAAIMRGKNEEMLLPKRGEKGDDFWRRFSMVVKVEDSKRHQTRSVNLDFAKKMYFFIHLLASLRRSVPGSRKLNQAILACRDGSGL